ncbi:RNA-binding protein 33-like isoform X3 [Chrysoperla carnea]|uniref:RNA-binding protein 33-like isoform X3 n=1 Tax=Chrysoperla carnea TaxID=189513 RepID=UPI001D05FD2E|nr:RNA-binding protein 33-like isoform X3 [Chrysoperla carnea]
MAEHDEEALLQEELDLDYEVDDELPEEELLGDNDDFDLEDNEAYHEEHGTGDDGDNEAHTTQEQEEDILDLGVTDTGIDDLDEEGFQNSQGGDDSINQKKERDRFHSERNTSGHTPIVFDGSNEDGMVGSTPKNQKYAQKYQRIINSANFRGRGGRGNFRGNNRGNFHNVNNNHNRSGFVHSRLGYRQQQARLVWDTQVQQTQQYQQQPFQNLGNFSQPIMQHQLQPQPQQHPPPQQIQLAPNVIHQTNWNNPPPHQNYPVEGHYNQQPNAQVGMPIPIVTVQNIPQQQHQPELYRNNIQPQIQFEQPKLGPMFVNNAPIVQQPPQSHPSIAQQQNYDSQNDWYNNNNTIENEPINTTNYGSQSEQHFKIPTQVGFRGRGGCINRGGIRIINQPLQNNTLLRTIPTEPEYNRPVRNQYPRKFQQNTGAFIDNNQQMNIPQQNAYNQPHLVPTYNQPQFQNQQQFTPHPQQQMFAPNEPQQQFIPNNFNHPPENIQSYPPQANVQMHQNQQSYPPQGNVQIQHHQNQQYIPPLNQQVIQRAPSQHTNPPLHNGEYSRRVIHKRHGENQQVIRRPYNQNLRSPQKRNNPIHSNEVSPKKKKALDFRNLQEVPRVDVPDTTVFFEDRNPAPQVVEEEDEETRAYRLQIEEQRKLREQLIKQKEERRKKAAAQASQSGSEVSTTTGNIAIPKVQNQPQRKIIKPLMERKILPPMQQNKNRLIVLTNQQKQTSIVRPTLNKVINRNLVKIENKQIMPNTVSSTQPIKKPLLLSKRVVRAIPRQTESVTSASSTTQTLTSETSESGDDVIDKEHLTQFLSTRTVVPKAPSTAVNGTITNNASALLKTNIVKISNLSASTTELKIRKLCKGVGLIQNIQMSPNLGQAIIRFKNIAHAHNFYKKYQRKMVDLSLIDVTLIPAS